MPVTIQAQYAVDYFPAQTPTGQPALAFVCKRAYQIEPDVDLPTPHDEPPEPQAEDELFEGDDPLQSSLRVEGDFVPYKPRVDVLVHATAYAPIASGLPEFEASVRVGEHQRRLRIVGPRRCLWQPPQVRKRGKQRIVTPVLPKFTEPKFVTKVAVRYEFAFGGVSVLLPADEEDLKRIVAEAEREQADKDAAAAKDPEAAKRAAEQEERLREFVGEQGDAKGEARKPGGPAPRERRGAADALDGDPEGADPELAPSASPGGTQILHVGSLLAEDDAPPPAAPPASEPEPEDDALVLAPGEMVVEAPSVLDLEERPARAPELSDEDVLAWAARGDVAEFDDDWVGREREAKEAFLAGQPRAERPKLPPGLPKVYYPTNPVGRGYAASNDRRLVQGLELPLIEDPERPITPEDVVLPPAELLQRAVPAAGLLSIGKPWAPRCFYAGLSPDQMEEAKHRLDQHLVQLDPEDPEQRKAIEALMAYEYPQFDARFYNGAPTELAIPVLRGNEEVVLENLTPDGKLAFRLPGDLPRVTVDRGRGEERVPMRVDTLWLDAEERTLVMSWRGHLAYGGPEELADYPFIRVEVEDWKLTDYVEKLTAKPKEEALGYLGSDTLILTEEDVARLREVDAEAARARAEAEDKARQQALGGEKYVWTIEDDEGTRREALARDRDVLHTDDSWIEALKQGESLTEEEQALRSKQAEREAVQKKKAELKAKLEAIRQREEEEQQRGKKKK